MGWTGTQNIVKGRPYYAVDDLFVRRILTQAQFARIRLTDLGQFSIGTSMVKPLEACGVDVRYIACSLTWMHQFSQLMHHKFLIADGAQFLTGSYNWSDTAERNNSENLQWIAKNGTQNAVFDAALR